jgi:hypothetical protein
MEDNDSSSSSEDNLQYAAVVNISQPTDHNCKSKNNLNFQKPPKDILTSKFHYLPLRINQLKCLSLLDCASNFSIVSPSLSNYLNLMKK